MTFSHTVSPHSRFGIILHSHLSLDTQRIPKYSQHFLCDAQNPSAWSEGKYVSLFRITADVLETILTSLQQQGSPGPNVSVTDMKLNNSSNILGSISWRIMSEAKLW